ncbi:MAG: hypothetical protein CVV27_19840, partial [Candidatus Melainabacteria bacterium HGW-Melainabacteria-1]
MISLEQKMLDHSASMILLVDTDGLQIVRANRQAGQVLGYTVDELLSHKIVDIESSLQDVFYWEEVAAGNFTEIEWQEGLYCGADGELIEVVPGAVATQHSGSGKANQYFLRGFNLDHGTDFTTYVDGIPMNMTTHAHGQGYMDLNSVIPELVKKIEYGKGPYYAEVGDFSAAGYAKMHTMDKLDQAIAKFTAGSYDYYRTLLANSSKVGDGDLLYAGEFNLYNGVWQVPEDSKKFNGMLKYTLDQHDWGMTINGKAYSNSWTATNQIPQSAIDSGALGLYGSMDPSDGGESNRYSLSSNFWQYGKNWKNDANIYALYTDLNLYSNFSGFTSGAGGDQILQTERRVQTGGNFEHTR